MAPTPSTRLVAADAKQWTGALTVRTLLACSPSFPSRPRGDLRPAGQYLAVPASGRPATIKAFSIVLGHVLGVIAARDRSAGLLPRERRTTSQIPMLDT